MTTERSGMSLEQVRDLLRAEEVFYAERGTSTFLDYKAMADAIDAHLSRDAVVSSPLSDAECRKFANALFGPGASENWIPTLRAALSSFAARHAAVPDAKVIPHGNVSFNELSPLMCIERAEAIGWNTCREAMLAQRDGG